MRIIDVFADGVYQNEPDEYAEIQNFGGNVNMTGWRLNAGDEGQDFYFPNGFTMAGGQVCRVYTNEDHPEWCGLNFGSGRPLWNNGGDCGYLYDGAGNKVDEYCY